MKSELAKFYGYGKEDAEHFVEGFELDCIVQGIQDQKIMLQLFRLCLQDGARLWCDDFGAQSRDVCYDAVKEAFLGHYKHVEDASDVWHQLEACLQKEDECVDAYAWWFSQLWNRWCIALRGQVPPFMLKKYHFVVGLRGVLKLKVERKRPQNYEDALRIAKDKEWKLKHQQAGVFGNTSMPYGLGSCYGNVNHAPYASSEVKMDSLSVKSEHMPQISSPIVVMGHCVDAIKGVHDVHVDEIEAHVPIEEEKDMANALAANHVKEMPIVLNVVEYEHEESVVKNVACDEVSFGLCALDVDNRLISGTVDVFGVALGHVLLDFMARSMVALVLYDGLCYICGLHQVYDACMVNKKQGTDRIGDDDDWGFDDPAVEMNEEIQPFADATLGRIWVMEEQQSHEVVMNSSEAIHMYGREGGSDVCVDFDYGLANIKIERNLSDMFTMEVIGAIAYTTRLGLGPGLLEADDVESMIWSLFQEHPSANRMVMRLAIELAGKSYDLLFISKSYDLLASSNASRITKRIADVCSKGPRCVFSILDCVKLQRGPFEYPSASRITIRLALELADKPYGLSTSSNVSRLTIRFVDGCSKGLRCVFSALNYVKSQHGASKYSSANRMVMWFALELADKSYDLSVSSNAKRITKRLADVCSEGPRCVFSALECVKLQRGPFEHPSASRITIRIALELVGKPYDLLANYNASRLTIRLFDGCSKSLRCSF
ncbi:hypothetical protein L7F22_004991 [Adiantum nelumboides]|nr:hypothetical protein [Adiantum nelumboides]